jgi:hypothetical protein
MFKGSAGYNEKYDRLTFWEQIDNGMQYTLNKKFLTVIPIVLFLFTISNCGDQLGLCGLQYTKWQTPSAVNLVATVAFCTVPRRLNPFATSGGGVTVAAC